MALVLGSAVAGLGLVMSPVLVANWIASLDFLPSDAGALVTIELFAAAISAAYVSRWLGYTKVGYWLAGGLLIVVLTNIACAFMTTFAGLAAARAVCGLGSGIVFGIFAASVAVTSVPERLYGIIAVMQGVILAFGLSVSPYVVAEWQLGGLYFGMALFSGCAGLCFRYWPRTRTRSAQHETKGIPLRGYALLLGACAISLTGMGVWSFSQQLGLNAGMTDATIGLVLGLSTLAGLIGAAIAAIMGARFGRIQPLVIGTLITTVSMACLVAWANSAAFMMAQCTWALSFYFLSPFILGQAATFDGNGQLAAITGGALNLGAAVGPMVFGWLFVTELALEAIVIVGALSLAFFVFTAQQIEESSHKVSNA